MITAEQNHHENRSALDCFTLREGKIAQMQIPSMDGHGQLLKHTTGEKSEENRQVREQSSKLFPGKEGSGFRLGS